MSCNVKNSGVHCSRQQCFVAEWSGHSVTVRVRARGNGILVFFVCVKM